MIMHHNNATGSFQLIARNTHHCEHMHAGFNGSVRQKRLVSYTAGHLLVTAPHVIAALLAAVSLGCFHALIMIN